MKHNKERSKIKRVQVTFTGKQWSLVERSRGVMGGGDAEIVGNMVPAWPAEKSAVATSVKKEMNAEGGGQK